MISYIYNMYVYVNMIVYIYMCVCTCVCLKGTFLTCVYAYGCPFLVLEFLWATPCQSLDPNFLHHSGTSAAANGHRLPSLKQLGDHHCQVHSGVSCKENRFFLYSRKSRALNSGKSFTTHWGSPWFSPFFHQQRAPEKPGSALSNASVDGLLLPVHARHFLVEFEDYTLW